MGFALQRGSGGRTGIVSGGVSGLQGARRRKPKIGRTGLNTGVEERDRAKGWGAGVAQDEREQTGGVPCRETRAWAKASFTGRAHEVSTGWGTGPWQGN